MIGATVNDSLARLCFLHLTLPFVPTFGIVEIPQCQAKLTNKTSVNCE